MKALLYILFVLSFVPYGKAQDYDSMPDTTMVDHARYGTYIYEKHRGVVDVHKLQRPNYREDYTLNKKYFEKLREFERKHKALIEPFRPTFYMQRMDVCIQSIIRNIRPYVKHIGEGSILMRIILNGSGKIKNIYFRYPRYLSIPAVALERLTMDMKEHCYATFKMYEVLEGADNIPFYLSFDIDAIFYDTIDENATYTYTP